MDILRSKKKVKPIALPGRVYQRPQGHSVTSTRQRQQRKNNRHGTSIQQAVSPQRIAIRFAFWMTAVVFFVACVYVTGFSPYTRLAEVNIIGVSATTPERIQDTTSLYLSTKRLGLFPQDNFFFFSEKSLEAFLLDSFRRFRSVHVEKVFPHAVRITVTERQSPILWCSQGPCAELDEEGYAFDFFDETTDLGSFVRLVDESAQPITLGRRILTAEEAEFFTHFDALFGRGGIVGGEYVLKSKAAREFRTITTDGWLLRASRELSPSTSYDMYRTFLTTINNSDRSLIEYLDLRVENKIFFKRKSISNEGVVPFGASSETEHKPPKHTSGEFPSG